MAEALNTNFILFTCRIPIPRDIPSCSTVYCLFQPSKNETNWKFGIVYIIASIKSPCILYLAVHYEKLAPLTTCIR